MFQREKAQYVFSIARDYLLQHADQNLTVLAAYHAAVAQENQPKELVHSIELKKENSHENTAHEAEKPKPKSRRTTAKKTVTEDVTATDQPTDGSHSRRRKAVSKSTDAP